MTYYRQNSTDVAASWLQCVRSDRQDLKLWRLSEEWVRISSHPASPWPWRWLLGASCHVSSSVYIVPNDSFWCIHNLGFVFAVTVSETTWTTVKQPLSFFFLFHARPLPQDRFRARRGVRGDEKSVQFIFPFRYATCWPMWVWQCRHMARGRTIFHEAATLGSGQALRRVSRRSQGDRQPRPGGCISPPTGD